MLPPSQSPIDFHALSLVVGSWERLVRYHDVWSATPHLCALHHPQLGLFEWSLVSAGISYRIHVPHHAIRAIECYPVQYPSPVGLVRFILATPPTTAVYIHNIRNQHGHHGTSAWMPCADFSHNRQLETVLTHDLYVSDPDQVFSYIHAQFAAYLDLSLSLPSTTIISRPRTSTATVMPDTPVLLPVPLPQTTPEQLGAPPLSPPTPTSSSFSTAPLLYQQDAHLVTPPRQLFPLLEESMDANVDSRNAANNNASHLWEDLVQLCANYESNDVVTNNGTRDSTAGNSTVTNGTCTPANLDLLVSLDMDMVQTFNPCTI